MVVQLRAREQPVFPQGSLRHSNALVNGKNACKSPTSDPLHNHYLGARLNRQQKYVICRYFKPSDRLEPSTPSLPSSHEAGIAGTAGNPEAGKPRKKRESAEEE